jgi:phosphoserine phosphatase
VRSRIFPEMASLVAGCARAGGVRFGPSAPPTWVVAEGVRDFGIPEERVLAAEVRVVEGLITSEIVDVPTGEGKAATLKRG